MPNIKKISFTHATGKTVYAIIRRDADGYLLNSADGTFVAAPASPFLTLVENAVIKGLYEASESRTAWDNGTYTVVAYEQTGGVPSPVVDVLVAESPKQLTLFSDAAGSEPGTLSGMAQLMVKDFSGRLSPDDFVDAVNAAIAEYSRHRPREIVKDIPGNNSHDFDEPAEWVPEFSVLRQVEYPVAIVPASILDKEQYMLYNAPDGEKIRLLSATPSAIESVRITFTVPRIEATIPPNDLDAVSHLAAAHALKMLANRYLDTSDPLISADTVNYRTKSDEASRRAKDLEKDYRDHLGIKDSDALPAASVSMDMSENYPGGSDRLTHARWARNKR